MSYAPLPLPDLSLEEANDGFLQNPNMEEEREIGPLWAWVGAEIWALWAKSGDSKWAFLAWLGNRPFGKEPILLGYHLRKSGLLKPNLIIALLGHGLRISHIGISFWAMT